MHDQDPMTPDRPASRPRRRPTRRGPAFVLALLTALVVAVVSGCSDDDAASDTSVTASPPETTSELDADATATTLSDEAFSDETGQLTERVEVAGDDLCAVAVAVIEGPEAQPATSEQVRAAVDAQVAVFRQLAATTPVDQTNAPVVEEAADRIEAVAEAAGYPVDLFGRSEVAEIVQGDEFVGAVQAYFERAAQECPEVAEQLGGGAGAPSG